MAGQSTGRAGVAAVVLGIAIPVVPLAFWLPAMLQAATPPVDAVYAGLYVPARAFALVGFVLMFYQFTLTARLPLLEKLFKRYELVTTHRTIGKAGFVLMLLHGVMMLAYDLAVSGRIYLWTEKTLGLIALILLTFAVIAAWFFKPLKLSLKTWRAVHLGAYVVFPLVFVHALALGSTVNSARPVYWLLVVLFGGYCAIVVFRLVRLFTEKKPAAGKG